MRITHDWKIDLALILLLLLIAVLLLSTVTIGRQNANIRPTPTIQTDK